MPRDIRPRGRFIQMMPGYLPSPAATKGLNSFSEWAEAIDDRRARYEAQVEELRAGGRSKLLNDPEIQEILDDIKLLLRKRRGR